MNEKKSGGLFNYDGKVSLGEVAPIGLQNVMAAIAGIITPGIMIAKATNLSAADTTLMIQISLVMAGIATLMQLFPIFGIFGARLPVILGSSFACMPILLVIGKDYGISDIFGATVVGSIAVILLGFAFKKIRFLFPPIVCGTVILSIGLSLFPVAIKYMAGGEGSANFGSAQNWLVAIVTFLVVFVLNYFSKGLLRLSSILIGMVVGYAFAFFLGMVNFDAVKSAGYFQIVEPLHFGMSFHAVPIITLTIVFIVEVVQSVGQFSATTTGAMGREATDKELSGAITGQGLAYLLGGFFGAVPVGTFGQNVGLTIDTKAVNKWILTFASGILIVAGFVPKLSSLLVTIPYAVIGGATLSVFSIIAMTGIKTIASAGLTSTNTGIVGLSLAAGIGVAQSPNSLQGFPEWVYTIFGSSEVILTTILAIVLNLVLNSVKDYQQGRKIKAKKEDVKAAPIRNHN
ncbi:nucleobase:cation symporter-2 family protein [Agrilactobacillus yilanensis]|uniref:Nucleobase:cation symporter-2 family protein n=1 Tax=Agrilactobacillus yilanensis TaxID=2485997 RepID=A0ABW4J6K7_9LACO|nr:nucleobase:cation symporter-2 family protein [Agrilactobacillus yilanensis]